MATFKHISSKNADYGAAEQYLTFEHDEFTMKPTLDENGRLIPREDYRISSLNCGGEDFAMMNELTKIKNVMKKVVPDAPDEVLLVLDGSTGQNAFEQAKQFTLATEVTAMAITKLDGTAKGGVVIGISDQFKIPVKYIGLGEGMEDLQVFRKNEFVDSLFGENA